MRLRELLHLVEGIVEIGLGVVRADAGEADALELERARIGDEAVDHREDIGAVVADEGDHRSVFARDVVQRIEPAIGPGSRNSGAGVSRMICVEVAAIGRLHEVLRSPAIIYTA